MTMIEITTRLTLDDLLGAVEKLPPKDFAKFVQRVLVMQGRQEKLQPADEEERGLLALIAAQRLDEREQRRLDTLRELSRVAELKPAEEAELLTFVQQVERQDYLRTEALVRLAQKRGVSFQSLLKEFWTGPVDA